MDCIEEVCSLRNRPLVAVNRTNHIDLIFENPNDCFEFNQVRVKRMDAMDAKGPVFARAHHNELLHDEEFCLQLDAHSSFIKHWDAEILREWSMTKNEFGILTTYPTSAQNLHRDFMGFMSMPHLCGAKISDSGLIKNNQAGSVANVDRPVLQPLWAAGLSFSRCHAERNVPNDINLKQVFFGEEFSRGVRLWTNGYDFYSLTHPIIGVYYGEDKMNHGSWNHDASEMAASQKRLMTLLKMPGSNQSIEAVAQLSPYGLGIYRTLEQYAEFSGVDTIHLAAVKERCIVWYIPWNDTYTRKFIENQDHNLLLQYSGRKIRFHQPDFPQTYSPSQQGYVSACELRTILVFSLVAILFILYRRYLYRITKI